jgi:hypothetical protein
MFHDMKKKMWMVLVGILLLFTLSCNNTPTVPLPPPDITVVSSTSPDEDGMVNVTGGDRTVDPDSVVLLYNDDAEAGVMEPARADGSFEAKIAAEAGDVLILQYIIDRAISYEEYIEVK